jgi:hypothetical protein
VLDLISDIKIHHHLLAEGKKVKEYFSVVLTAKDKIEVVAEFSSSEAFSQSKYYAKHPRLVTIAGSCLLHKTKLENQSLTEAIPFFSPKDYYIDNYEDSAQTHIVLAKKIEIDSTLLQTEIDNPIIGVLLSEIAAITYIGEDNPERARQTISLSTPNYTIQMIDGGIKDIVQKKEMSSVSAFALQTIELFNGNFIRGVDLEYAETNLADYSFIKQWKKFGLIFVGIWLVLLLVNFGFFQSIYSKASIIPENNLSVAEQILKVRGQINQFSNEGSATSGDFALLADYIGREVPPSVTLTSIELNPLSNEEGTTTIANSSILVNGNSKSSKEVNIFIKGLKTVERFSNINVIYIKMLKSQVAFELEIKYTAND